MPQATVLKPQSYSVFVYNSSGSQSGNRFNSWADLMTATAKQGGPKTIIIEQNETIPSGAYNLDYVTLAGNGLSYDSGGFTLTFPTGVTITSWTFGEVSSLRLLSTSTDPIWTTAGGFTFKVTNQSQIWGSSTDPFILNTGGGQCIFLLQGAGRMIDNGYEAFETTASAFSCILVIAGHDNHTLQANTLRSTNGVIFGYFIQNVVADMSGYPTSQANLSVGADISAIQTKADALGYTNTASGLAATTVQAAIDEIADPTDVYTPTNVTVDRSYDANSTSTDELADVLGTLIADLQARSIIG